MSIFDLDPEGLHLVKPDNSELIANLEDIIRLQFDVINEYIIDCIWNGIDVDAPEQKEKFRELLENTNWLELLYERKKNGDRQERHSD